MVKRNSLGAICIIIVSIICLFSSVADAGYWVDLTNDDFETGFGNWTTDGSQCTWIRNQDNTPSNSTGPCGCYDSGSGFDHTIGDATGWYAYVETSGSVCQGSDLEAILEGPDLDADTYSSFALTFYYHMYGSNMGDLHVDVYNGTSWETDVYLLSGQQQINGTDAYLQSAVINLDSYTGIIKVRFRYNGVTGYRADVAIDDIEISGWVDEDDMTPPTPNPAEFDTVPAADSATSISMTAVIGTDFSPPIEYSFVETTGNPGATNSGWTTSNTYTDNGLSAGTTYTYTVQMRDNSQTGANTGTASSGLSATTLGIVPDVTLLVQATAEANITSAGFVVGSIGQAFSNSVPLGNVISQLPVAGTELVLGSSINLNVSKGTNITDFEDLVVFAANWLDSGCGICNDQDYSGDNDVDFEDFSFFSKKWKMEPPLTLVINEFMASNDSIIADGFGDYDDWIEIYNYGTDPVMMDGMHLADSANTYIIPSGITIDPNTYLIFWADDETGEGPLHTNFKLGASGDEITLYESDGIGLIDSIIYRADQTADISHGRYPDNTPDWYNMDTPTPGSVNQAGMAGEVWFSKLSGTFTTERIDLELFTGSPTDEIRYTINGTMPTATSTLYTGPIWVSIYGAARIRARAFDPTAVLAPGPVTGHYYIPLDADVVGFSSNLPIVVIETYSAGMNRVFKPVGAVFIDIDKDTGLAKIDDVPDHAGRAGLKLRGESSATWPKKHYGLELRDENDLDIKASLFGMPSESDWILNNPYGDKSLIRNVLAYKWANDIGQGFAAPGTKLVEVFVHDVAGKCSYSSSYRGVYVLTEKIKASQNRLDIGNLGPLDNAEPEITGGYILRLDKDYSSEYEEFRTTANMVTNSDGQGFQYFDPDQFTLTSTQKSWILDHFNEYETVLNSGNFDDTVNGYAKYIDVESFVETDIIAELFKEADGFRYSTYLYKEKNGKIGFGPEWDYNFSSGNATNPGWGYPEYFSRADTSEEGWYNYWRPAYGWHTRLLEDFEYKLGTADKWFEHREDKLSDTQVTADIDYYYNLLTTNVAFTGGPDNAAGRNFSKWPILNTYQWCNYYYGYNSSQAEQGNLPHTYKMETEWLKNWFNGQGTPAAGEWYLTTHSDRLGHLDLLWASNRNIVAPPVFLVNSTPMDTGGSITVLATLTMTAATSGTIYYTLDGTDPREAFTGNAVGTAYSSGITLNETKQVKARIKNGSNWSALNEAVFSDDRVSNSLRITEIMYHPVNPDDEYIEFKNIGPATINLAHCRLTKGVDFTFPSVTLAPNAYTIVVRDIAEFNARYPSYSGTIAGEYTLDKLDNGGENIRLKDAAGNIIQEFEYEDNWFPITDGAGFSINSINLNPTDPNDWNKRLSWQASNILDGTPGQDHVLNTIDNDDIVINEVLTHTDDSEGDWIELHNTTGSSIDVGGWYLSDDKDNLKKYRIASPTNIPSGGYLVLTAATNFQNAGDSGSAVQFGLSEHGEDVYLTSGNGTDIAGGYSAGESFGSSRKDVTFGRYTKGAPTFNVDFIELISMTQGTANSAPYVPDVVITEIMYNAQDLPDLLGEYIELHNRDTGTVYLYDLANPDNIWKFTKGIDFTFPTGVSIGAGQKILISRTHPEAFKIANGDPGVPVYGPFESGTELENDGEKIELSMPTEPDPGTEFISYIRVEQVNYSDGIHPLGDDPWPTSADGRGDSLHRTTLSDYSNDVANWSAASPSPGS